MASGRDDTTCPEATVEIKIKTLDSQTYTLRVDKCVPVPALKEQIASVTGVISEQQRLICRGKVLKDDQLLSAYHVEDGHTLHLVVRQPMHPSLDSSVDHSVNDPASSSAHGVSQSGPSVVVGTFNISEPGDGVLPDLSRIVSAVLGSFGVTNIGSGSEGADLSEASPEGLFRSTHSGSRNPSAWQTDQTAGNGQSNPGTGGALFSGYAPLDPLQLPVIPDSLTTLSQYLTRMRNEFSANVRDLGNSSQAGDSLVSHGQDSDAGAHSTSGGLPTPASLADVILSTRQLLTHQSAESLFQLARQLEDQANVTDPLARMTTQSNAIRTGVLLQHLGALLLELGRTTMTLRMGQTPTEAVVNAGPAVFISTSGPNPIMVQPLHFQHGASFGAIPSVTGQFSPGMSGGSVGSGFFPRNIDIRIRTGPLIPSSTLTASQREATGVQHPLGQSNQSTPDIGSFNHEDAPAPSGIPSSIRESEVRVIPIRTVVAALPASVRRPSSDTSRGSVGVFYPVVARVQRVPTGNLGNQRGPGLSDGGPSGGFGSGQQPNSNPTVPQDGTGLPGGDANIPAGDGAQNGQGFSTDIPSGFDQLLRSIFPGEHIHASDVNLQGMGTSSATSDSRTNQDADAATIQESAQVMGDGVFLSNLLRQIMPMISGDTTGGSAAGGEDVTGSRETQASSTEGQGNADRGTRSRRLGNPPSSPSSKRQRR